METLLKVREKFPTEWHNLVTDSGEFEEDFLNFAVQHPNCPEDKDFADQPVQCVFDYLYKKIADLPSPMWVLEYIRSAENARMMKVEQQADDQALSPEQVGMKNADEIMNSSLWDNLVSKKSYFQNACLNEVIPSSSWVAAKELEQCLLNTKTQVEQQVRDQALSSEKADEILNAVLHELSSRPPHKWRGMEPSFYKSGCPCPNVIIPSSSWETVVAGLRPIMRNIMTEKDFEAAIERKFQKTSTKSVTLKE